MPVFAKILNRQFLVYCFLFLILCFKSYSNSIVDAKQAQIDLTGYTLDQDELVEIGGQWRFMPHTFTSNFDSIMQHGVLLEVCKNDWKSIGYTNFGYGSYAVTLVLHNQYKRANPLHTLGLTIRNVSDSYRLFINGQLYVQQGKPGVTNEKHQMQMGFRTIFISPQTDTLRIVIQVSNYSYYVHPGIQHRFVIGSQQTVFRKAHFKNYLFTICLGIMLLFALYHFVFSLVYVNNKDSLFFAIICLIFAVKCLAEGDKFIFILFPDFPSNIFFRIWHLSTVIIYFLAKFYRSQFPNEISQRVVVGLKWLFIVYAVLILTVPISYNFMISDVIGVIILGLIIYICTRITLAVLKKRAFAWWHLFGILFLSCFGVNDVLYGLGLIKTGYFSVWAFAIYIMLISTILSLKAVKAYRSVEVLTRELAASNHNLERLVTQRTQQLNISNQELLKLIATRDRFFSILAHDLRGPISTTRSLLEIMTVRHQQYSPEKMSLMIGTLSDSSNATYELLENLLNWAKAQRNEVKFEPQWHSFSELINESVLLFSLAANHKDIRLETNISSEARVFCDRNIIHTVLRNLINNALKFTPSGGSVSINSVFANKSLEISVVDTGVGMDTATIESLLGNDAVQQSNCGTNGEKGSGLGFVLCREFIKLHQGSIRIESQPGKGSCFTVTIPQPEQIGEEPTIG